MSQIELRDYQKSFYDELTSLSKAPFRSIVCIPTGGGKTLLASLFSIDNALKNGKKILWVTHSQYLLNQAYETIQKLLGNEFEGYKPICIHSGTRFSAADITTDNKLIVASFQSLHNNNDWQKKIGENTMIVIDEVHHFEAKTFRETLEKNSFLDNKTIIGLSATPIRSKYEETNSLYRFFDTVLKSKVSITDLFKKGILVRPIFDEVHFDMGTNNIKTYEELTSEILKQIENYNNLIFNQYETNEERYGKTVIFAMNKSHADSLEALFLQYEKYRGRVFKVYSGLNNRAQQFNDFKNSKDGILININVISEGVDIPDIRTVFLTKPLNSRIQVTQIIGRALRKSNDTNKTNANIVNFAVSNIGRKFMVVSPKLVYQIYEAECDENFELEDSILDDEKNIETLEKTFIAEKRTNVTSSFTALCFAGHYEFVIGDKIDLQVPVTIKEYKQIEKYIIKTKAGKKARFPQKLFFFEDSAEVKSCFDKCIEADKISNPNISDNTDNPIFSFVKYDEDVFVQFERINRFTNDLYNDIANNKNNRSNVDAIIEEQFERMKNDQANYGNALWYLNQIGANNKLDFIRLIKQDLTLIGFEKMYEKQEEKGV